MIVQIGIGIVKLGVLVMFDWFSGLNCFDVCDCLY